MAKLDLSVDPNEEQDLLEPGHISSRYQGIFEEMQIALDRAVPDFVPPAKVYAPVDPALRERLQALGYESEP